MYWLSGHQGGVLHCSEHIARSKQRFYISERGGSHAVLRNKQHPLAVIKAQARSDVTAASGIIISADMLMKYVAGVGIW